MLLLILRDLQYRRWRVAVTVLLMAIVMTLLFVMAGLVNQFNAEPVDATFRTATDLNWVVSEGTGGPFTSPRPLDAEAFAEIPGEPILVAASTVDETQVRLVARSYELSEPELFAGRYPVTSGEVLVDDAMGLEVGDPLNIGGLPASVVGVTSDATVLAGVPLVFVTLEFGQETVTGGRDMLLAKLTDQAPSLPAGLKLLTSEDVSADTLLPLDGAIATITLVKALLWLITIIIIAAIIYISALERTRDIAVLKAVGGRSRELGGSLLVQGVIMTLLAVALAGVAQIFIAPSFPLKVTVPPMAWLSIAGGAVLSALVAGAAGVRRVNVTSPTEAFG